MLTVTQYLIESVLQEERKDVRMHPPKFTADQKKNNKALFQQVAYQISKFDKDIGFAKTFNIADNAYYRTTLFSRNDNKNYRYQTGQGLLTGMQDIELLTDSVNGLVTLKWIASQRYVSKWDENGDSKPTKLINNLRDEVEKGLKSICKSLKRTKINSGQQFGYSWKLQDPDYSKAVNHNIRIVSAKSQIDRKSDERREGQRELTKWNSNERVKDIRKSGTKLKKIPAFNKLAKWFTEQGFAVGGFDNWTLNYSFDTGSETNTLDLDLNICAVDLYNHVPYEFTPNGQLSFDIPKKLKLNDISSFTINQLFDFDNHDNAVQLTFTVQQRKPEYLGKDPVAFFSGRVDLSNKPSAREITKALAEEVKKYQLKDFKKVNTGSII